MSVGPMNAGGGNPVSSSSTRGPYLAACLIFAAAAGVTLYFTISMSRGMPMPGGWSMSMMWMPMGASRVASAAMFSLMWLAMMIAMMLPSTMPMLLLYRRVAAFRGEAHLVRSVFALGSGYFGVWTLFGLAAYVIGVIVTRSAMRSAGLSHVVPLAGALALCVAGSISSPRGNRHA